MKNLLVVLLAAFTMPVFAQNNAVSFSVQKHGFGKVQQGKPVTTEFSFTNNTDKPVVVESATAECGCTKPEYPEQPILKGKTGTIKVTYNAANMGTFTKKVTVKFANIAEPIILTIDGEVIKKD